MSNTSFSKITPDDVLHLAKLANLKITQSESEKYATQIASILEYVKKLEEVDTENVEPTAHISGTRNVSFKDGSIGSTPIVKSTLKTKKLNDKIYFSSSK
ncbi:MAG TPA: Asp-tRNA(Asn)/Glu-tRNA(Gln) amidotransferase subunit GatC [Candidatus Dojkabacteria bacterium]|mgnify:CR=1 FL=1|nr:Asp-tRNA(Asn)/Glu-tRNA(Gln) amidotransferase subunit GatC [Candidatus Dojkabacteria bacterium]HQF37216.1 Asp-tRNA(Asn)/Glu-tRNA(Gln) amidotransferase subunit GatC [Candidatus Dojkabacteria bacterium]